ncbi:uncharacterized protein BCR38DRAFT_349462 [Pseudomassariella vexata]|uniref:Ribonuclease H1 N-terminal domain-containing protein n=1 Tax=Pseudomassariella vexata TaxID=1141098 RepID=A0A1Y2DP27_9PEZI|nr:uncharacterized protein BCR38DRAFT_349462 [Pseudomassariella vexata]ORY61000.1 hypothetical protein BCR38DRAFT_349462 [Pseudomassariella vexata]
MNKEYYAVFRGRVNEPTIFSSWGDAHPRVTGCISIHKSFFTIEDARKYMSERGVTAPKEILKPGAGDTSPLLHSEAFYAVAHGKRTGILSYWYGTIGSEPEVKEISGACHKRFKTRAQAEAFIEDWKESYADVWRRAIKEGLDKDRRPHDMKVKVKGILRAIDRDTEGTDDLDKVKLDKLSLTE